MNGPPVRPRGLAFSSATDYRQKQNQNARADIRTFCGFTLICEANNPSKIRGHPYILQYLREQLVLV